MACTIWQSELTLHNVQDIHVPKGAEFLCAMLQNDVFCVWYRCDPDAEFERRKIAIIGTGNPTPPTGTYLGTIQLHNGKILFHVFVDV